MSHKADALARVVTECFSNGVRVEPEDGWRTRGGSRFDPKGFTVHHDASPRGSDIRHIIRDGHASLSGPLANLYLTRDGTLVVIAAGRANHAGRGGWKGLHGNSSVWGLEIANDGVGEPYTPEQLRAVLLLMRAFVEVDGVPVGLIHSHAEWAPDRKRDPALDPERQSGPWNMDRFRHDVSQQPEIAPPEEDEMLIKFSEDGKVKVMYDGSGKVKHLSPSANEAVKKLERDTDRVLNVGEVPGLSQAGFED